MPAEKLNEIFQLGQQAVNDGTATITNIKLTDDMILNNVAQVKIVNNGTIYCYYFLVASGVVTTLLSPITVTAGVAAAAIALGVSGGALLYNTFPNVFDNIADALGSVNRLIGNKILSFVRPDGTTYLEQGTLEIIKNELITSGVYSKVLNNQVTRMVSVDIDSLNIGDSFTVSYKDYVSSVDPMSLDFYLSCIGNYKKLYALLSKRYQSYINGEGQYTDDEVSSHGQSIELELSGMTDSAMTYALNYILSNTKADISSRKLLGVMILPLSSSPNTSILEARLLLLYDSEKAPESLSFTKTYIYNVIGNYDFQKFTKEHGEDIIVLKGRYGYNIEYCVLQSTLSFNSFGEFINVSSVGDGFRQFLTGCYSIPLCTIERWISFISNYYTYTKQSSAPFDTYQSILGWYDRTFKKTITSLFGQDWDYNFRYDDGGYYRTYQFPLVQTSVLSAGMANKLPLQENGVIPSSDDISDTYPDWGKSKINIPGTDDEDEPIEIQALPLEIQDPYDWTNEAKQDEVQEGQSADPDEDLPDVFEIGDDFMEDDASDDEEKPQPDPSPEPGGDTDPAGDPEADDAESEDPPPDPEDPNDQEGGDEGQPIIPAIPTNDYSGGLACVFNPTEAQMQSVSNMLWGSAWSSLIQLFTNPLETIVSFHRVFVTPTTGDMQEIYFGTFPSGVSAKVVPSRYVKIDLGTIAVPLLYNNSIDYSPYSKCHAYLPFIGFVELDIQDIMQAIVRCEYVVDVYNGDFSATLYCTKSIRQSISNHLSYTYKGNMSIQSPLFASDMMRTAFKSLASGVMATATGGVTAGLLQTASTALFSGVHYQKSGSLDGNVGATLQRNPFIEVTSPLSYDSNNYKDFYGYPSNKTVYLGNCNGFIRVKEVHLRMAGVTSGELEELEGVLKAGIIV